MTLIFPSPVALPRREGGGLPFPRQGANAADCDLVGPVAPPVLCQAGHKGPVKTLGLQPCDSLPDQGCAIQALPKPSGPFAT